jgi:hypothetical protein
LLRHGRAKIPAIDAFQPSGALSSPGGTLPSVKCCSYIACRRSAIPDRHATRLLG